MQKRWYTADTHFGTDPKNDILIRENRPFKDVEEYTREQVRIWNEQASADDVIYVIGDFCNYNHISKEYNSGLAVSKLVNAHIILITGNGEERVIEEHFGGDFEKFREYCLNNPDYKFRDVLKNEYLTIGGERFFLTHLPTDHDTECLNLFGHTHRATGIWRPYGFNMGTDLNHFRLFDDDDIGFFIKTKNVYWDIDPDCNC